jgi:hypothetical protein
VLDHTEPRNLHLDEDIEKRLRPASLHGLHQEGALAGPARQINVHEDVEEALGGEITRVAQVGDLIPTLFARDARSRT